MEKSVLPDKSYVFDLGFEKTCLTLPQRRIECVISQLRVRSGTTISHPPRVAEFRQDNAEFINVMTIAPNEANESAFWLEMLNDSALIDLKQFSHIKSNCDETGQLLVSSLKDLKNEKQR